MYQQVPQQPLNYTNYLTQRPNLNYYDQMNKMMLKGRPVSSLEEVRAIGIDFDGSLFFFPDIANKRIYTKQINLDGTAQLNMYELKDLPQENPTSYVTKEEFDAVIGKFNNILSSFAVPKEDSRQQVESKNNTQIIRDF